VKKKKMDKKAKKGLISSIVASLYPEDKKDFRFLNTSSLSNSNRNTILEP
jgi:hypothetical protein